MENTGDFDASQYHIYYYPSPGCETVGQVYEDDHANPKALQKGEYAIVTLRGSSSDGVVRVEAELSGSYPAMPVDRQLMLTVERQMERPASVAVNGRKLKIRDWSYDSSRKSVTLTTPWRVDEPLIVELR
mgnify:FL=1